MNRSRIFRLALMTVLALSLALSGIAMTGAQGSKVLRVGTAAAGDTVIFDPALADDTLSHTFIEMLFPGLAPRNEVTAVPEHGLAESWSISDDATVYTFTIRQDVPWVRYNAEAGAVEQVTDADGNVLYVTAHDFVYGGLRIMDPATAADYAYLAADWTVGGPAFMAGEGSAEDVMLKALDDYTLEVTSPSPAGFLLQVYGGWLFTAQPKAIIEEHGDAWTLPENVITYGNMVLKEYDPGNRVVLVKNPFWPGTESHPVPAIDELEAVMLDASAQLAAYEAGELDSIQGIPLPDIDRLKVEYPDEFFIVPQDCTYYYGFNVTVPPVDNVHMRRALSMAIDRQSIVEFVTKGGQQPAGMFSRPNHPGAPTQAEFPELGVYSDPAGAQAELALYFEETGTTIDDLPVITLMFNTSEAHAQIAQAVQQMWKDTLGIEVEVTNQEWQTYQETLEIGGPAVWRLGWCWDYSDVNSGLNDVFLSTSGNNHTFWVNEEFDALVTEAKTLLDYEQRKQLYAQAEQILTWDDAAMAPIYFYTNLAMIQDYVDGVPTSIGSWRYDKWDIQ